MDTINIIITSLTTVLGLVGGGVGVFFWKESKRGKQIDNELKEADEWKKLYNETYNQKKEKSQKIGELFREIDRLKKDLEDSLRKNDRLKFEVEKLSWHKCVVNGCPNRKPPRNHVEIDTDNWEEQ